uniref:Uncharacterized protein n=1 Tax=Trichinella nativa TaxID=6335 RepID=A0A0V1KII7_9BILA
MQIDSRIVGLKPSFPQCNEGGGLTLRDPWIKPRK